MMRRKGVWYAYFYPFRGGKKVGLRLDVDSKGDAKAVEAMLLRAVRIGDYGILPRRPGKLPSGCSLTSLGNFPMN